MMDNNILFKLLENLDWDGPVDLQNYAIEMLSQVSNLNVFMQPDDTNLGPKVWENCALILTRKTNEELIPYLKDLFQWLQEEDTPGFFHIYERMEAFNYNEVTEVYNSCLIEARNVRNYEWLDILNHLKFKKTISSITDEEIDVLFENLDWNVNHETQRISRQKLSQLEDLRLFMQKKSKSTWENCALILNKKTNHELFPYLKELFEWLQDLNWPGAFIVRYRLQKFPYFMVKEVYEQCLEKAKATNDETWLDNLEDLVFRNN